MVKKKNNITIFIIIALALLVLFGGNLFSLFIPRQDAFLIQYYAPGTNHPFADFSDTVTIDNGKNLWKFKITEIVKSGGDNQRCIQTVQVFKNNNLIETFIQNNLDPEGLVRTFLDDETNPEGFMRWKFDWSFGNAPSCSWVSNTYEINYSNEDFEMAIDVPTTTFIVGQNVTVNIEVVSNLNKAVLGNLNVDFTVPTFFGEETVTLIQEEMLSPGNNIFVFELLTNAPIEQIEILPRLEISLRGDSFNGLNSRHVEPAISGCGLSQGGIGRPCVGHEEGSGLSHTAIESDEFVFVGTVIGDSVLVSVSPQPIYLPLEGDVCPIGYDISEDGTYCIIDEFSGLACVLIGCPIVNDNQYICTSTGACAQGIFIPGNCVSDEECSELFGEVAPVCDVPSGACFNQIIYDEFVQCEIASDCINPCPGITSQCSNSICTYEGQCDETIIDCTNGFQCPEGATCELDEENNINSCVIEKFPVLLILGLIGIIIVFAILFFARARKKRR